MVPLVPVIVTSYAPVGVDDWLDIVSVELPNPPGIVVLESDVIRPVAGETVAARLTVPVKPFSGATVRVEVPIVLGMMERDAGLARRMKSGVAVAVVT